MQENRKSLKIKDMDDNRISHKEIMTMTSTFNLFMQHGTWMCPAMSRSWMNTIG